MGEIENLTSTEFSISADYNGFYHIFPKDTRIRLNRISLLVTDKFSALEVGFTDHDGNAHTLKYGCVPWLLFNKPIELSVSSLFWKTWNAIAGNILIRQASFEVLE